MALFTTIQKFSLQINDASTSASANLSGGTDETQCVPMQVTKRLGGSPTSADNSDFCIDVYFTAGSPPTVTVERAASVGDLFVELVVGEFDPAEVTVQQIAWTGDGNGKSIPVTLASTANAFHIGTHKTTLVSGAATIGAQRYSFGSTSTFHVQRISYIGTTSGHFYIAESINGGFTVQHTAAFGTWDVTTATASTTITTVTPGKSFVIASYEADNIVGENAYLPIVNLKSDGTAIELQRVTATGSLFLSWQVVSLAGSETVQHAIHNEATSSATSNAALASTVTPATSIVFLPCQMDYTAASLPGIADADEPDRLYTAVFADGDNLTFAHNPIGGEANNNISYSVIDFGGAPPPPASGIESDDFQSGGTLDAMWTETDPQGDCTVALTGQGTGDAYLTIAVPTGANHDAYIPNNACRVMQSCTDTNFEIVVKMEGTKPAGDYASRGLMVHCSEDSGARFLRFDQYYGGGDRINLSVGTGAAFYTNPGNDLAVTATDTFWLKLTRSNNVGGGVADWVAAYSTDGSGYTTVWSWTSNAAGAYRSFLTPTAVGVMAGNTGTPAYTAVFDYFFESSAPISPEDGVGGPAPRRVMVR